MPRYIGLHTLMDLLSLVWDPLWPGWGPWWGQVQPWLCFIHQSGGFSDAILIFNTCRVDDLKSGRESARVSSRGLVRAQHTNSRGENAFNAMTLSNQKPRLFFTTICGFQVFNPATERWRVVGDLSSPRRGLSLQVEKYFIYLSWQWPSRLQRVVVWWLWGAGDKYILKDLLNQKYFSFLFSLWNLIRPGISYMQFIYPNS